MVGQGLHRVDERRRRPCRSSRATTSRTCPASSASTTCACRTCATAGRAGARSTASTASASTTTGSAASALLERPLEQFLADAAIDFPFCICWANENWTRRWDGARARRAARQQDYATDGASDFIRDVSRSLRDPRYMRVDGKPLLARVPASAVARRRAPRRRAGASICRRAGIGEVFARDGAVRRPRTRRRSASTRRWSSRRTSSRATCPINDALPGIYPDFRGFVDRLRGRGRQSQSLAGRRTIRWPRRISRPGTTSRAGSSKATCSCNSRPARYRDGCEGAVDYARRRGRRRAARVRQRVERVGRGRLPRAR